MACWFITLNDGRVLLRIKPLTFEVTVNVVNAVSFLDWHLGRRVVLKVYAFDVVCEQVPDGRVWQRLKGPRRNWRRVKWPRGNGLNLVCLPSSLFFPLSLCFFLPHPRLKSLFTGHVWGWIKMSVFNRWTVVVRLNLPAALQKKESVLLPSPQTHKHNAGLEREAKNQIYHVMSSPVRSISAARMRKDGRISGEFCSGGEYSQKNWKEGCGLLSITPTLLVNSLFQTCLIISFLIFEKKLLL